MPADDHGDIYFEFVVIGAAVKVTALDAATGTEVSVMGPAQAAPADLRQLAMRKLLVRLAREEAQ